jgi:hypothetical protein
VLRTGKLATCDPHVFIEEQHVGYIRYRRSDGRRWEVLGTCAWTDTTRHGPCGEGAVNAPYGPPEGRLDVPVTPELKCSLCVDGEHLTFKEL